MFVCDKSSVTFFFFFFLQLALIRPTAIRGGRVIELWILSAVNMISSQISRPPAQTKLDTPSQEKKIPCPLASNVGNVITANCRAYSVCNELIGQQNYLAATVRSLDEISLHCGQRDFKHSETAGRLLDL